MKRIRLKNGLRFNGKIAQFMRQLPLAIFAAVVIISIIISLPFTERYLDWMNFDLNPKDDLYQVKTYILEIPVSNSDEADAQIEELKNVINKRLDRYGVEVVRFFDHTVEAKVVDETTQTDDLGEVEAATDDPLQTNDPLSIGDSLDLTNTDEIDTASENKYLKVVVETTKDLTYVDRLVRTRNALYIVTPKEDAVFDDPENPLAQYLPENYDRTSFGRDSFRNIIIKELPSTTGDTAYFSIYKVSLSQKKDFLDLMDRYAGQMIGIEMDGFVTPYYVPAQFAKDSQGGSYNPEFSPVIGQDPEDANLAKILLNSGVIKVDYEIYEESTSGELTVPQIDYQTAFFVIIGAVLGLAIFLAYNNKNIHDSIVLVTTVLITNAFWLVILKFFLIEVDLPIILISGALSIAYICMLVFSKDKNDLMQLIYLVSLAIAYVLSSGFLHLALMQLLVISVMSTIVEKLVVWFENNMRTLLLK